MKQLQAGYNKKKPTNLENKETVAEYHTHTPAAWKEHRLLNENRARQQDVPAGSDVIRAETQRNISRSYRSQGHIQMSDRHWLSPTLPNASSATVKRIDVHALVLNHSIGIISTVMANSPGPPSTVDVPRRNIYVSLMGGGPALTVQLVWYKNTLAHAMMGKRSRAHTHTHTPAAKGNTFVLEEMTRKHE